MRTVFCTCRPKILGTGKEQKISITGSSGLSKDEVEKMQREAEAHAEEDKKAKEAIEIKNNADMLAYQSEKQLKELGDKISGDKKKQVEDAIAAVRDAINRNDTDAMKRTYDDLQNKFQEVSAELYKQASAQAGPRPGPQPGPEAQPGGGAEEGAGKRDGGDVVDAEFEVVDENKKKVIGTQFAVSAFGVPETFRVAAGTTTNQRSDNNNLWQQLM